MLVPLDCVVFTTHASLACPPQGSGETLQLPSLSDYIGQSTGARFTILYISPFIADRWFLIRMPMTLQVLTTQVQPRTRQGRSLYAALTP